MQDNILDTLIVQIKGDDSGLQASFAQAAQESQRAGHRIGQQLGAGVKNGLGNVDTKATGTQAGQEFGEGFKVGADGRLRDAKGKFVKTGKELGESLTDGMSQGVKEGGRGLDSAVTGLTASLGGGAAGGGLTGGFGRLTAGAGGLTASLTSVVGALGPVAAGVTAVTTAVTASVVAVNSAINVYAEYEYKLAKISTLTDKTPDQLKGVGRELQALSRETGKSIDDLGEAMYAALGASVRGAEDTAGALNLVTVATKTASAGATDTATAMEALTNVLNAYRMEAGDAAQVSDKMVKAVAVGKMTFPELAQSLGMVTAIASQAGVSLDEVLGSLATMTANGIQMSSAVDYLRSAISAVIGPSDEAQKLAKKLGVEFSETALKSKGFEGVLKDVMRATGGSTEQLKTLFGGVEAVTAVTSVASGNFERLTTNIKAVGNAAGETNTQASKMTNTLKVEGERFNQQWASVVRNMGEVWAPLKVSLLTDVNDLLEKFNKMLERWNIARSTISAGNRVLELETQIKTRREAVKIVEAQTKDPAFAQYSAEGRARVLKDLETERAAIKRLEAELKQLKAQAEQARSDQAAYNFAAGTPPGMTRQGPQMGGSAAGADAYGAGTNSTEYQSAVAMQALRATGVRTADQVVDYCAQWVRLTLGKADAKVAPIINKLFQTDSNGDGNVTANDAARNVRNAGLMKQYTGISDLRPGDTVFYEDGGAGHVGIYIGGGMVRGNNRVSNAATGNPVGNVAIDRLGTVTGFARSSELAGFTGTVIPGGGSGAGKDDLAKYSLTLADWNKNQARALELAREASRAESDLTGKRGLQVKAAMEKWAGEDKARQQSYQLAVQLTARQEQAAAKSKAEQERAAAEAKRDQEKAAQEAEARQKEAQQRAARINEALRQGKIESARLELGRLQGMRENDLRNAGENAQRVAQVEQRYATLTYNAKAAIAAQEKKDRDADINNDKTLNGAARAQALKNSNQTYLNALKAAGNERRAALDGVNKDLEASAAKNAAVMPGLMSGWVDDWAQDQEKDRAAAAAGAAVVDKLFAGAIDQLGKSRAEMEAALTDALNDIYQKAIDAGIDPFGGGSPDQFRDMDTPGRSGLAALIGGNPAGFMAAFTATGGTPDALLKEFADADWETLGLDVLQGLADGMRSDTAWDGVRGVVEGALGRILAESAFAADVAALVSDRDGTLGAPAGIMTGNERPEGESTPLAQSIALRKAVDDYAASLRDMREDQLAAAEAEAIAADNADFYNAILAERARRLQEQKDKAEAAAKAERDLADALAQQQTTAITQAAKDVAAGKAIEEKLLAGQQALDNAMGKRKQPYADEIKGLEELRAEIVGSGGSVEAIDAQIAAFERLQKIQGAANVFMEYAGYARDLSKSLAGLAEASGDSDLAANLNGAANLAGQLIALAGDVARIVANPADIGAWVGAITKVINGISEAMNGFRKAREQAAKMQKDFNEQFTFINGDNFSKTFTRSRGWLADTFGGGPEVKQEIDKIGLMFAKSLEGGFVSGIKGGLKEALEKNDFSLFSKTLKESVYDGILEGIVDAFINGELLKNIIGPAIKAWADAMKTPDTADDAAALAGIDAAISQVDQLAGKFFSDVAPKLNGIRDQWGIEGSGGGSGADNRALFGNAPTAQLGIPRFEVTLPDTVMKPLGDFAAVIPAFSRATDRLYEAADMIVRANGGLQRTTGLAPL